MAELKTRATTASVEDFLNSLPDPAVRADCQAITALMRQASGDEPKMWGASIVGFGCVHLKYASGRELDWMVIGFSPRKQAITLYLPGALESYAGYLGRLGRHKTGRGCLYIRALREVDQQVLQDLIRQACQDACS